ncbi:putative LRR receptor-like serine/threonine-protein kinase [Gossypium australe]|uniref:Putative LRR receptor-like serine/threonine-protein kinase n=1 Tax=Gossypium australe TaxID=47621 RepID=A0A5B6VZI8_9ROSI|nr:putative LRR receptor-like serine/threonine-protein kinase [Gossypium australe]
MYIVGLLSKFMYCCNISHFKATTMVLKYIKGTVNFGVWFMKADILKLAGLVDDMRSTSGYLFSLHSSVFFWSSKKQQTIAQSIVEAEYMAVEVINQAI